jgi:ketosteroid isomerase-like protein
MSAEELGREVRKLFENIDRRDAAAFLASFTEDAEIVHDDGAAESPSRLVAQFSAAPLPVRRRLSGFRGEIGPRLAWVAYENEVTFDADGFARTLRFAETALLRREPSRWRFVRIHYSGKRP